MCHSRFAWVRARCASVVTSMCDRTGVAKGSQAYLGRPADRDQLLSGSRERGFFRNDMEMSGFVDLRQ